jgi:hypothetical protein
MMCARCVIARRRGVVEREKRVLFFCPNFKADGEISCKKAEKRRGAEIAIIFFLLL